MTPHIVQPRDDGLRETPSTRNGNRTADTCTHSLARAGNGDMEFWQAAEVLPNTESDSPDAPTDDQS